jgi:hypothetical protein
VVARASESADRLTHGHIRVVEKTHETVWIRERNEPEVLVSPDSGFEVFGLGSDRQTKPSSILNLLPVRLDRRRCVSDALSVGEEEIRLPDVLYAR